MNARDVVFLLGNVVFQARFGLSLENVPPGAKPKPASIHTPCIHPGTRLVRFSVTSTPFSLFWQSARAAAREPFARPARARAANV